MHSEHTLAHCPTAHPCSYSCLMPPRFAFTTALFSSTFQWISKNQLLQYYQAGVTPKEICCSFSGQAMDQRSQLCWLRQEAVCAPCAHVGKSCLGAGLPEELRGTLLSSWTMGILGTLSCFLTTFFLEALPGCFFCPLEAVPLTGGCVKPAGNKEELVSGGCWTG